jgi:hypothetical protein
MAAHKLPKADKIAANKGGDKAVFELFGADVPKATEDKRKVETAPVKDEWLSLLNDALFTEI